MSGTARQLILACAVAALTGCTGLGTGTGFGLGLEAEPAAEPIPEQWFPDAGIFRFTGDLSEEEIEEKRGFPEVRRSETLYFPQVLRDAMLRSGGWRHVWFAPGRAIVDLEVHGEILRSDGAGLEIRIRAEDSTGVEWLDQTYEQEFTEELHARTPPRHPAQEMFDQIASDLLAARDRQGLSAMKEIRRVTEVRFAQEFLPEAFDVHLGEQNGRTRLVSLPAQNDPLYQLTLQLKERDDLFLEKTQQYVHEFSDTFDPLYRDWTRNSYLEIEASSSLRNQAILKSILGGLLLIGGVAAAANSNTTPEIREIGQLAAVAGLGAGYLAYEDYQSREIHDEALLELGQSLNLEMADQVVQIENRTHTLTGSVEQQYGKWHEILKEIYQAESGERF